MNQQPHDTAVIDAATTILGEDALKWARNGGPQRLGAAIERRTASTGDEENDTREVKVIVEGWRYDEVDMLAQCGPLTVQMLQDLVRKEKEFMAAWTGAADSGRGEGVGGLMATQMTHTGVRGTPWREYEESELLSDVSPKDNGTGFVKTWTDETRETSGAAAVRLGRAWPASIEMMLEVPVGATTAAVCARARESALNRPLSDWIAQRDHTIRRYIDCIKTANDGYAPPCATRLNQRYVVEVRRLLEQSCQVVINGIGDDHERMLEDAITGAQGYAEWEDHGCISDYVGMYDRLEDNGKQGDLNVPESMGMIARI